MRLLGQFGFLCLLVITFLASPNMGMEKTALVLSDKVSVDEEGSVSVEDQPNPGLANDVFVPTSEWQTIKEGQAIPRGLHVRLNLATGEKEAKLTDDAKGGNVQYWENEEGKRGMINADGSKTFSREQLKQALKKFDSEVDSQDETQESEEAVKSKFRSYEELKKDLEQLRMQVKSDLEIMTELLVEFKKPETSDDRKVAVLEDLEYLVHQIDNAQNFVDMGGFTLLGQLLNSTDPTFREWAAFVVGSATQSNPKVQIAALENGILHHLIRLFHTEQSSSVRRKYLFAFSAMLRNFPYAQKKFMELGGFETLGDVLRKANTDEKHKFKIVTLLSDLLHERLDIEHRVATFTSPSPILHQTELLTKHQQYREAPLGQAMVDGGWCKLVGDLLSSSDTDNQERVLRAMDVMMAECKTDFGVFVARIRELGDLYRTQLAGDSDNEYLKDMISLAEDVLTKFVPVMKDEL